MKNCEGKLLWKNGFKQDQTNLTFNQWIKKAAHQQQIVTINSIQFIINAVVSDALLLL